jgi:hypothetical protein
MAAAAAGASGVALDMEWLATAESMSAHEFYAKNGCPEAMDGYPGHQPFDLRTSQY